MSSISRGGGGGLEEHGHTGTGDGGGSISPAELPGVSDFVVQSGDDAQGVIEAAPSGSVIGIEPSSYNYTPPFDIPSGVKIIGAGRPSDGVVFEKSGNGQINLQSFTEIYNIRFNGNSASYSGDGIVDANTGVRDCVLQRVRVEDMAGDARVTDGGYFNVYLNCRFANSTYGYRATMSSNTEVSSNVHIGGTYSKNTESGVYYDDTVDLVRSEVFYNPTIADNKYGIRAEPAGDIFGPYVIGGKISLNDGPGAWLGAPDPALRPFVQFHGVEFVSNNGAVPTEVTNAGTSSLVGDIEVTGRGTRRKSAVVGCVLRGPDSDVGVHLNTANGREMYIGPGTYASGQNSYSYRADTTNGDQIYLLQEEASSDVDGNVSKPSWTAL